MIADPARRAQILARTPMGRTGEDADLAGVAVFLAGPWSRFITGQTIAVDGGMRCW